MLQLDKNLRKLRKETGLTQEQLADKLGVTFQAVSRWETGAAYPDISLLPELAAVFHVTADELLGIPGARAKDISVALTELKKASAAPMNTRAIIASLRELRHFHISSPDFWSAMRALPRDVLKSAEVRTELRLVFDAIWESGETKAYVKSQAVVWRACWEEEDRLERFLESYSTSDDLSREELMRSRAEFRQDWAALEPMRQKLLMRSVTELASATNLWLPQGTPAEPEALLELTALQLRFLNSLTAAGMAHPEALDTGELDGWAAMRVGALGTMRLGCLTSLGQTEQAMTTLAELTELMERAFSIPLPASIPCPSPWFGDGAWTVREVWRQCWWENPEQEERCLEFNFMGYLTQLLTPSLVVDSITGNGVMKLAGHNGIEPLRSHPDYPALADRLKKLVIRRKAEKQIYEPKLNPPA